MKISQCSQQGTSHFLNIISKHFFSNISSSNTKNISKNNGKSALVVSHKRTSSRTGDLHASGGSRKRKSKRTSTLIAKDFKSNSNLSFMKKNKKTIFKILNNKKWAKKIVPTIPPKSDRSGVNIKSSFRCHRSKSNDRNIHSMKSDNKSLTMGNSYKIKNSGKKGNQSSYPTTSGNRAHLIAAQRDMLIPQTNFLAQLQEMDN